MRFPEVDARRTRYLRARLQLAHLPFVKAFDQFDFGFQPSIDEKQIRELRTLRFVHEAGNVILLGPPGVGKTLLSEALAEAAIQSGFGAYFMTAHDLVTDLGRAYREGRLDRRMRVSAARARSTRMGDVYGVLRGSPCRRAFLRRSRSAMSKATICSVCIWTSVTFSPRYVRSANPVSHRDPRIICLRKGALNGQSFRPLIYLIRSWREMTALFSRKATLCVQKILLSGLFLTIFASLLRATTIPGLGTATFATSTRSAAAQSDFMRGLLLLHLFEYQGAAKSFAAAEKKDPGFAMAYWGEAMTFNHPVWNQLNASAGQAALARFGATPEERARRIADPREKAYMSALEILYSGRGTKRERDANYASAMQQLSQAYPNDDEAQLFYALALLGKSEGVRDVPTYLKAAEIAKTVFIKNPDHPGAAHYWIHGMDDPQHAAGALEAANALSKIAPDAGHAQHMCSHIFLALGLWDDVVRANVAAAGVVNRQAAAAGRPPGRCGHYNYWLEYGYLEQGRILEANKVVAGCRAEAMESGMAARARGKVDPDDSSVSSFVEMRARYIVDTGLWHDEVAGWHVDMGGAVMPEFNDAFGTGFAAAMSGDLSAARHSLSTLDGLSPQTPAEFDHAGTSANDPARRVPEIQKLQLQALILSDEGHDDQAIAVMQQAVAIEKDLPYAFGPPSPEKPTHELLGELLLKEHKTGQARAAFETSLKLAPRRAESLLGLARAESAERDKPAAIASYRELLQIWRSADSGYAPSEEARHYVSTASRRGN